MSYPGDTVVGDGFEILTKLSSGGMGDVLLARRRSVHGFEKLLAIKTIRGELAKRTDIRAMFNDEARLSARLDHPAIAQVYDYGEDDGSLFLAMEYVPGIALNKLIMKMGGPVPPPVAARIIAEVCRGLHAAHELRDIDGTSLGVVHRDVSPGNLILTFDGHIKILDFGIAFMKNRESPDTVIGELKGKPSYMAPEHLRGQTVDRRADIYSVSVVLHELLTGRKLFTRDTVVATVLAVETSPVHPPSAVVATVPPALDGIVLKGLERRPEDRFPDARAMAAALDRAAAELGGDTLESFVEDQLAQDREAHRSWLQAVLSGTEPDRTRPGVGPLTPSGRRPVPVVRDAWNPPQGKLQAAAGSPSGDRMKSISKPDVPLVAPARPAIEARPLADPTTLVPGMADQSQPQAEVPGRGRAIWMWPALAALSLLGLYVGYRAAFDTADPIPAPLVSVQKVEATKSISAGFEELKGAAAQSATVAAQRVEAVPRIDTEPRLEAPAIRPGNDAEPSAEDPARKLAKKDRDRDKAPHHPAAKGKAGPAADRARAPGAGELTAHDGRGKDAKAATTFGYVTVGAQPYALVRIDGQEVGATPIIRKKLGTGTHEILLIGPDNGEVRLKRVVTLSEGEHQRVMLP